MKANEAREIARKVNTDGEQFDEIIDQISKAAKNGDYHIWHYRSVKDDLRKRLTDLGFDVGESTIQRNESLTKISWSEIK